MTENEAANETADGAGEETESAAADEAAIRDDTGDPPALSTLTTLRVGGRPRRLWRESSFEGVVDRARGIWTEGRDLLVLGGGSNLLIGDEELDVDVLQIDTRGIEVLADAASDPRGGSDPSEEPAAERVRLRVAAGESWDELVAYAVAAGYAGIEALSGIPGRVGASPVQNIGAYGQELASTLRSIEFLDADTLDVERVDAAELDLGYRTSTLKRGRRGIVLSIDLDLFDTSVQRAILGESLGQPVEYRQLADALGVARGDRVSLERVRTTVLALRGSKGMVLDADDPDSVSAGSFFTNPIVSEHVARSLPADAPRWPLTPEPLDRIEPLPGGLEKSPLDAFRAHQAALVEESWAAPSRPERSVVKLSAAWLIERSGIRRGYALPGSRAAISSKHTLALTNRGGATAEEIAQLARFVKSRVQAEFGIVLAAEPVVVGVEI